jgi:hypothetical protein
MRIFSTTSWKTTSAGLTLIAGAVVHLWFSRSRLDEGSIMLALGGLFGGIGLLVARDNDKTSEQVGVDPISKSIKAENAHPGTDTGLYTKP